MKSQWFSLTIRTPSWTWASVGLGSQPAEKPRTKTCWCTAAPQSPHVTRTVKDGVLDVDAVQEVGDRLDGADLGERVIEALGRPPVEG